MAKVKQYRAERRAMAKELFKRGGIAKRPRVPTLEEQHLFPGITDQGHYNLGDFWRHFQVGIPVPKKDRGNGAQR